MLSTRYHSVCNGGIDKYSYHELGEGDSIFRTYQSPPTFFDFSRKFKLTQEFPLNGNSTVSGIKKLSNDSSSGSVNIQTPVDKKTLKEKFYIHADIDAFVRQVQAHIDYYEP